MKSKLLLSACLLSALSLSSQAGVVTSEFGGMFDDLGGSTIDLQTGLEWLDVTTTINMSYEDVFADINQSGGLFEAGVWRYATASEVVQLGYNWFGLDITDIVFGYIPNNTQDSLEAFITMFGDTGKYFVDSLAIPDYYIDPNAAGYTYGYINSYQLTNNEAYRSISLFMDYDFYDAGVYTNWVDVLSAQYDFAPTSEALLDGGSFLVRDLDPVVDVPEPSALSAMLLGLMGIGFSLRRKNKKDV